MSRARGHEHEGAAGAREMEGGPEGRAAGCLLEVRLERR